MVPPRLHLHLAPRRLLAGGWGQPTRLCRGSHARPTRSLPPTPSINAAHTTLYIALVGVAYYCLMFRFSVSVACFRFQFQFLCCLLLCFRVASTAIRHPECRLHSAHSVHQTCTAARASCISCSARITNTGHAHTRPRTLYVIGATYEPTYSPLTPVSRPRPTTNQPIINHLTRPSSSLVSNPPKPGGNQTDNVPNCHRSAIGLRLYLTSTSHSPRRLPSLPLPLQLPPLYRRTPQPPLQLPGRRHQHIALCSHGHPNPQPTSPSHRRRRPPAPAYLGQRLHAWPRYGSSDPSHPTP
mmetsp:Transcript_21750/g.70244  ORF Transcript_21750/g.70244 Transcript_21750/m.70244 type:complete len:297 (+) Transcript_21750:412-1302(+)|eukprot:scaffold3412_cov124-Isochrysis_galbana.AAC.6